MITQIIPLLSIFLKSGIMEYFFFIAWGLATLNAIVGLIRDLITWGKADV